MPPHLKRRGSIWYIADAALRKSLNTTKKGIGEYLLEQYIKGKYGMKPTPTVGEFFERWIQGKVDRRSTIRDYSAHFQTYILPTLYRDARVEIDVLQGTDPFIYRHPMAAVTAEETGPFQRRGARPNRLVSQE